ncbi:MAG: alpha/beta hydrolase [Planctomycetes bacterium]|nr:alpha/beta hydrolase [Planctomycetota bacterium]
MLRHLTLLLLSLFLGACAVTGEKPQPDGMRRSVREERRIAWENRGGGSEALVFVHGWGGDHSVWHEQMQDLFPWRRIAIDLPGHGASDKPRIEYTVDVMVEALRAVLDDARVERAVLVGHSNGAVTVRRFLELYPERVAGLVIVDGPLRSFFASPEEGARFLAPLREPDWKEWTAHFLDGMLAPMHDATERARVRALMLGNDPRILYSSFLHTLDTWNWPAKPIEVPLLLVLSENPAWEGDYRAFVEGLAPRLRWERVEGVSHFLMLDEPERFDELLRRYLVEERPFERR